MTTPDDASIELEDVHLTLGRRKVFSGLSCSFPRGKITVLLGGSGAGKSTMLRLIGGLTRPDAGRIDVCGTDVAALGERALYDVRERIGMLFQGGALLDAMTIGDNVALPLREHSDLADAEIRARVTDRLEAVGLNDVEHLLPGQLSGGMNRRAALARAIVQQPEIVICDEPFSGLDPVNVRRIENLLVELNRTLGLTMLVTSHHIPSSLRMADWLVFVVEGRALAGTPAQLMDDPDPRLHTFLTAESEEFDDLADPNGAPAPGVAS